MSNKDRVLFYIDENTRIARDRSNFISQYRTKEVKDKKFTGKYSNNWENDRFFNSFDALAEKVALIDVRMSDALDVQSLAEAINNMVEKLDTIKEFYNLTTGEDDGK